MKKEKKEAELEVAEEATAVAESEDVAADIDEVMRKYDKESNTRIWTGVPKVVITVFTTAFSLFCIFMTLFSKALPEFKLSLFLGCIMIIGFLNYPINKKHVKPNSMPFYDILIMLVGAGSFFWFAFNAKDIVMMGKRIPTYLIIFGIIGILCMVELCRRCVGIPILCVVGALLIYAFINKLSFGAEFTRVVKELVSTLFYSTNGMIGTPVKVCYTYIVLFIIFGAFLERTGIAEFFIAFANRIAGWSSGGPAKVAVISSALCGMVSGSSVGNTVTTGSVTIPMMKKTGYRPEFAGAVEAAASTGGQIMPPIMGAAAFLMAEYMGIPYAQVAVKAILPAVLYFAGIFIAVHLEAKKLGLKGISKEMLPKWSYLLKNVYLMIPLVLLVALVSTGAKTMAYSAALSIICAAGVGCINFIINALVNKQEGESSGKAVAGALKKTFFTIIEALVAGGKGAVTVAVACAMAGMIAGCITATGLASVLINGIVNLAGNYTIIGLALTMLCCIILGMGVPTTANYCIMAATCAPILVQMNFPVVAAHFFVFYFGIVADITPPVALAAYAGSAIAKSNPMKTGINATKLAIAAFIVPYIFAYSPAMLFEGENITVLTVLSVSLTAVLGLFAVAAGINGYLIKHIPMVFRLILVAGGLCMMIPGWLTDVIGLAVVGVIIAIQLITKKNQDHKTPDSTPTEIPA